MPFPWRRHQVVNGVSENELQQHCFCSVFVPESTQGVPRYIAAGFRYGHLKIYDFETLTKTPEGSNVSSQVLDIFNKRGCIVDLKAISIGVRGTVLISLNRYGDVFGWDWNQMLRHIEEKSTSQIAPIFQCAPIIDDSETSCICVNTNTNQLITGDWSGDWHCWDIERLCMDPATSPVQVYSAHDARISRMDCYNGLLASSACDGTVCIWDIRSESCISAIDPFSSKALPLNKSQRSKMYSTIPATAVCFDKSGRHVVSASGERRMTVWNVRSDSAQCSFDTEFEIHTLDTSKDYIFCPGQEGNVVRYSTLNAEMMTVVGESMEVVNDIHIDREVPDKVLVSGNAATIEVLGLNGYLLGSYSARKHSNRLPTTHQIVGDNRTTVWHPDQETEFLDESIDNDELPMEDLFGENDDLCDSGTEGVCSENEEAGRYYVADDFSSILSFSENNDDGEYFFPSDEELSMVMPDTGHPTPAPTSQTVDDDTMDQEEEDVEDYYSDSTLSHELDSSQDPRRYLTEMLSGEGTSDDEDSLRSIQ